MQTIIKHNGKSTQVVMNDNCQFIRDLENQTNAQGATNLALYNLAVCVGQLKLFSKGIKPSRHWRLKDVKNYFGLSGGTTIRDENCERLKLARSLYGMGLKVAGVSLLCQDARVFDAMMSAGTPCPFEGKIGDIAKAAWLKEPMKAPENTTIRLVAEAKALEKQRLENELEEENENTE